jgi:hypothetical protein
VVAGIGRTWPELWRLPPLHLLGGPAPARAPAEPDHLVTS